MPVHISSLPCAMRVTNTARGRTASAGASVALRLSRGVAGDAVDRRHAVDFDYWFCFHTNHKVETDNETSE